MIDQPQPYRPAGSCEHPRWLLVRRTLSNGATPIGHQCERCGAWRAVSLAKLTRTEIDAAGIFDPSIAERWYQERAAASRSDSVRRLAEAQAQAEAEREAKRLAWFELYNEYLAGPVWAAKRRLALERDGHTCQGCLRARATTVHHTTYPPVERFGEEPLYWLRSLCDPCHESVHRLRDAGAIERSAL